MDIESMAAMSRRDLLVSAVAGGIALGTSATVSADSHLGSASTELGTGDTVAMYRKLRYRSDAGLVMWWLRGIKYGQVGSTLTALYANHVGTVMRVEPREDGGMDVTSLEITVPMLVNSSTPMREWTNPYTGEVLPVTVRPIGPTTVRYDDRGARDFPTELGGARLEVEAESLPPTVVGDRVFLSEHVRAKVFRPNRDGPYVVNDMSQFQGSLAQLSNPATVSADATVSFGEVTGWQRWMNMGDRPGGLTSRTVGAKVASIDEMPAVWRQAVATLMPDLAAELLADPNSVLDRPAAEFDR